MIGVKDLHKNDGKSQGIPKERNGGSNLNATDSVLAIKVAGIVARRGCINNSHRFLRFSRKRSRGNRIRLADGGVILQRHKRPQAHIGAGIKARKLRRVIRQECRNGREGKHQHHDRELRQGRKDRARRELLRHRAKSWHRR